MLASHKRLRVCVHVCMYICMYVLKALNLKMKVSSAIKCGYKEYIFTLHWKNLWKETTGH